uniref:hypothetical protein n=1 Tax=Serratia entomophila TaxID=42906 RepID=UPI001F4C12A3|nr:hypothetical protein [Serratia entomophila]
MTSPARQRPLLSPVRAVLGRRSREAAVTVVLLVCTKELVMKPSVMKPGYRGLRERLGSDAYRRRDGYLLVIGGALLFWALLISAICLT